MLNCPKNKFQLLEEWHFCNSFDFVNLTVCTPLVVKIKLCSTLSHSFWKEWLLVTLTLQIAVVVNASFDLWTVNQLRPARRSHVVYIRRTYSAEGDKSVLPRVDFAVIGPVSPHVRGAVDQPGGVEHKRVSEEGRDEIRHPQRLAPHVPRHERRHEEAHQQHGHLVVPETVQSNSVKTDILAKIHQSDWQMCPWSTNPVISSTGIFVAIANNTLYGLSSLIFFF